MLAIGGCTLEIELWDTAGRKDFRKLIPMYIHNSFVAVIVFDLSSTVPWKFSLTKIVNNFSRPDFVCKCERMD